MHDQALLGVLEMKRSTWGVVVGLPLIIILVGTAFWGYQFSTHSTPEKAQAKYDPTVGPFEKVKFANGVVLITPSNQSDSVIAWYMTKGLFGWHVSSSSNASLDLAPQVYNVDFEPFVEDGQTFVWGTALNPIKEIVYHHKGKIYTSHPGTLDVWYMVLPFPESYFLYSKWTMVLPNGTTAPLFKN